ncbi:SHOCT domain-containing protein [Haladaptatus sp. DYF46]|uniref:SHOCT domain-containing protein n=1 Tax=Haladaptatus sp. DYF46 TaxID=2886041 RepID=UPI001E2CFA5E|nr:SHOCT domain-containing protein [Haladaptatus sp. DYF46]
MTTTTGDSLLRLLVVALLVLLLVPMLVMFFAFPMMGGWMMGGRYGGYGAMSVWGWLIMLLPFGLLVALGVLVYRILRDGEFGTDPALSELRMAYARGDISEEEFERRRERLRDED